MRSRKSSTSMTILAADIGGTHSRFAVFDSDDGGRLSLVKSCWLPTAVHESFASLVEQVGKSNLAEWFNQITAVVVAVPGPVDNGAALILPNVSWSVNVFQLQQCFPDVLKKSVYLINDFVAHAMACQTSAMAGAICVQRGEADPIGAISLIGAGTGLGFCSLVPNDEHGVIALPSEAGHQTFPFQGDPERQYETFLQKTIGETTIDGNLVVSGRGLALLHKFVTGQDRSPSEVSATLTPTCEVTHLFAKYYGRAARNYALSLLSTGGLYVSGGVASKNHFLVDHDAFRTEFSASPAHHRLLKRIPISLNINQESGFWGAARYATIMLEKKALK